MHLTIVRGNPNKLRVNVDGTSFYVQLKDLLDEKRFARCYTQATNRVWFPMPGFRKQVCAAYDIAGTM